MPPPTPLSCCATDHELLVALLGISEATFDRLAQINESIAAGTAASCPCTSDSALQTGPDMVVAVAGTAVQGPTLTATRGILVVASPDNDGPVYIGNSTVTNAAGGFKGIILTAAGMPSQFIEVDNANKIWINADNAGDLVGLTVL